MKRKFFRRTEERRAAGMLFAPVSILLILFICVLAVSVFFRVTDITVEGCENYTPEEIIEASGIESGDNLFFINRFSAVSRIFSKLPYIESASITRSLPNSVLITVTESEAVACLSYENVYWAIDRSCRLLAEVEGDDISGLITVTGMAPLGPKVGDKLYVGDGDSLKVDYLSEILYQLVSLSLTSKVTEIDMSNVANPVFDYDGRFRVKLGAQDNIEYKFQLLLSAVDKLEPGDSGTLDLSIDQRAHLTYD